MYERMNGQAKMHMLVGAEVRLRLGNAQINFDNFGCASAIENKFSWHLACTKFGISLDLH